MPSRDKSSAKFLFFVLFFLHASLSNSKGFPLLESQPFNLTLRILEVWEVGAELLRGKACGVEN